MDNGRKSWILQEFEMRNFCLLPSRGGKRKINITPMMMASVEFFIKKWRNTMYDGGPGLVPIRDYLGAKIFATIDYEFGQKVDVRVFYKDTKKGPEPLPTQAGVRLSLDDIDDLSVVISQLREGNKFPEFKSISSPCFIEHRMTPDQKALQACQFCCPEGQEWE